MGYRRSHLRDRLERAVARHFGRMSLATQRLLRFDGGRLLAATAVEGHQHLAADERDEVSLTAMLAARIEAEIRDRPEQWLWYHDRWRPLRVDDGRG